MLYSSPPRLAFPQRSTCVSTPRSGYPIVSTIHQPRSPKHSEPTHHIIPSRDDRLHIQIRREESDQSVGNGFAHIDQDTSEVPHDGGVVSHFESGTDGDLVTASCDDLQRSRSAFDSLALHETNHWQESIPGQCHRITLHDHRLESKHFRVHLQRRDGS